MSEALRTPAAAPPGTSPGAAAGSSSSSSAAAATSAGSPLPSSALTSKPAQGLGFRDTLLAPKRLVKVKQDVLCAFAACVVVQSSDPLIHALFFLFF